MSMALHLAIYLIHYLPLFQYLFICVYLLTSSLFQAILSCRFLSLILFLSNIGTPAVANNIQYSLYNEQAAA